MSLSHQQFARSYTDCNVAHRPQHFSRSRDRRELSLPRSRAIADWPLLSSSGRSPPLSHNYPGAHRQHSDEAHGPERLTRVGRWRQRHWKWHTRRSWARYLAKKQQQWFHERAYFQISIPRSLQWRYSCSTRGASRPRPTRQFARQPSSLCQHRATAAHHVPDSTTREQTRRKC